MNTQEKETKNGHANGKQLMQQLIDGSPVYDQLQKIDLFNHVLNQPPPKSWLKKHPFIKQRDHFYLPIERVEWLLSRIFKHYRIEILREGTSFNGVYVVCRIHVLNPVTGQIECHDGIGACELQTRKDSSPADMASINPGALAMAFPIAKSYSVKDACHHFGKLFGSDVNRKENVEHVIDDKFSKLEEIIA